MKSSESDLGRTREGAIRHLLYPVIFSLQLDAEAKRVCVFLRSEPREKLDWLIRETKDELDHPSLQVHRSLELIHNPSEAQVREYLRQVVSCLERDLAEK